MLAVGLAMVVLGACSNGGGDEYKPKLEGKAEIQDMPPGTKAKGDPGASEQETR